MSKYLCTYGNMYVCVYADYALRDFNSIFLRRQFNEAWGKKNNDWTVDWNTFILLEL